MTPESKSRLLECIVEQIVIPNSYYAKASTRHKSLGEWLCRPESKLATFNPAVHLQGSFRYGTVTRPLNPEAEYDLDNVTTLQIGKTVFTQKQIKEMFGIEIRAYADAHGMTAPAEEKNRCWRLRYADGVLFHLDALPCLPEDPSVISALLARNVPMEWARRAVAITDKRHPDYDRISSSLLSSNPRGFAHFFIERARPAAVHRIQKLVEKRLYASIEAVPPYEWQTPLQQSIQLLKRHRDVMFKDDLAVAPISMIITNLAARAYQGGSELWSSLVNIVGSMPYHVNQVQPYVPNPANPNEDYADRWTKAPELKFNFETWLKQVTVDLERISRCKEGRELRELVRRIFSVELPDDEVRRFEKAEGFPAKLVTASPIVIGQPPKPWGQ
jgi:hypothetical protein